MYLPVFQAVLYLAMAIQLRGSRTLLPMLLLFVGFFFLLVLTMLPEGRFQHLWCSLMAAAQIGCGLTLILFQNALIRDAYIPMAVEHLLIGLSTLFLPSLSSSEREKRTLKTVS